jgi:4-diphosphocytidyl-2-C-methyl-D-erythritol kinase
MITLTPPAKINWSLYVLDKRDDGYHNIISLMQCIDLHDTITLGPSSTIELYSDMKIPAEQNLIFKAALALREVAGTAQGARIYLTKEIPSGAGLGGGSSDAAYALIGLNRLWGLKLETDVLKQIGVSLGSDVPFFFDSPSALAQGRGEMLCPEHISSSRTLLLIKPGASIPTAWAYEAMADLRGTKSTISDLTNTEEKLNNIKLIVEVLNNGPLSLLRSLLHNDFEKVVMGRHHVIGEIKERLLAAGASAALLSGSGSAVFGLFEDRESAHEASQLFSPYWNRVVNTL